MEVKLYRLKSKDVSQLIDLNKLFADVFEDYENYLGNQPSSEYLRNFLSNRDNVVIVAENKGDVIGGLVAYVLNKFEQSRKELYIYDLAVAKDVQRHGVGKNLVNKLLENAKELDAYVVFVQADEGDEAVHFYESLSPSENIKTRSFDFKT